jgi:hypothetical protein
MRWWSRLKDFYNYNRPHAALCGQHHMKDLGRKPSSACVNWQEVVGKVRFSYIDKCATIILRVISHDICGLITYVKEGSNVLGVEV